MSALPLAALAVRPLSRRLPSPADFAGGSVLLAAGLLALALLPASDPAYAVPALALAGAGLGLALPPLTRASVPDHGEVMRSAVVSVGVRHLGLVVGLLAVAPLLAAELDEAEDRATINATAVILDAPLPIQTKIPVALDLYDEFQATPEGRSPTWPGRSTSTAPMTTRSCAKHATPSSTRCRRCSRVRFARPSRSPPSSRFSPAPRRSPLPGGSRREPRAPGIPRARCAPGRRRRPDRDRAEQRRARLRRVDRRRPLRAREPFPGDGFEATLQRIALDGLDGAACELGTTREELVLSFDSQLGGDVDWDQETLERALRSGLEEAIADAEERGSIGGLEATILRELVSRAPLDWLIEGGGDLADLFGGIFDRR